MRTIRKAIALILAIITVVLLLSSCKSKDQIKTETVTIENIYNENGESIQLDTSSVFKLPFARSDSLNPFFAETVSNQILSELLYDGLFQLNKEFDAEPMLAESFSIDKNTMIVQLKQGQKFSESSVVTGEDVVYSFKLAKSSPAFGKVLEGISSAKAEGNTVTFTLAKENIYATQLLTFPILKSGTGNTTGDFPVGTGKFVLKIDGVDYFLNPNGHYDKTSILTRIELVNVESQESIENSLRIGNISFIFNDLADGTNSKSNSKSSKVPLNNLVYLGFNPSNGILNSTIRKGISYSINREEIAQTSYHGFASAAKSVFNPYWSKTKGAEIAVGGADSTAAKNSIAEANYKNQPISLLVNNDNSFRLAAAEQIVKQLSLQGFNVQLVSLPSDQYFAQLGTGVYDMFLGEVKLTNDMSLDTFFSLGGPCSHSINLNESLSAKTYAEYISGNVEVGNFIIDFKDELPIVPVIYRKGMVSYSNQMKVKPESIYGNLFSNISQWTL